MKIYLFFDQNNLKNTKLTSKQTKITLKSSKFPKKLINFVTFRLI